MYGLTGITKQSLSLRIFIVLTRQISDEMDAKEVAYEAAWKRSQYAGRYQDDWKRILNGIIPPSKLGDLYNRLYILYIYNLYIIYINYI